MITFLTEWLSRLRHVRWFGTQPVVSPMSVAEHSYHTAILGLLMGWRILQQPASPPISMERLMARLLLHDLEEAYTNDINSLYKRRLPAATRTGLGELNRMQVREMIASWPVAVNGLHEQVYEAWEQAKQGPEGQVVQAADAVAMFLYAYEELQLGNSTMLVVLKRVWHSYVCPLEYPWFREWKSWLVPLYEDSLRRASVLT